MVSAKKTETELNLMMRERRAKKRLKVACVKASKPKERQLLQKKKSADQGKSSDAG